jgi:hypothetical protein
MSAKRTSSPVAAKAVTNQNLFNPWTFATDFGKQQINVATESAGAIVRGFDAMRKVQLHAGERAMTRHSAVLEKMKAANEPLNLLALQTQLMAVDAENTSLYWQDLGAAMMEMQSEILGCCSHLVDSEAMLHATAVMDHLPSAMADMSGLFGGTANSSRQ